MQQLNETEASDNPTTGGNVEVQTSAKRTPTLPNAHSTQYNVVMPVTDEAYTNESDSLSEIQSGSGERRKRRKICPRKSRLLSSSPEVNILLRFVIIYNITILREAGTPEKEKRKKLELEYTVLKKKRVYITLGDAF